MFILALACIVYCTSWTRTQVLLTASSVLGILRDTVLPVRVPASVSPRVFYNCRVQGITAQVFFFFFFLRTIFCITTPIQNLEPSPFSETAIQRNIHGISFLIFLVPLILFFRKIICSKIGGAFCCLPKLTSCSESEPFVVCPHKTTEAAAECCQTFAQNERLHACPPDQTKTNHPGKLFLKRPVRTLCQRNTHLYYFNSSSVRLSARNGA